MSEVAIVFTDIGDGKVAVGLKADPPLPESERELTPAQIVAGEVALYIHERLRLLLATPTLTL